MLGRAERRRCTSSRSRCRTSTHAMHMPNNLHHQTVLTVLWPTQCSLACIPKRKTVSMYWDCQSVNQAKTARPVVPPVRRQQAPLQLLLPATRMQAHCRFSAQGAAAPPRQPASPEQGAGRRMGEEGGNAHGVTSGDACDTPHLKLQSVWTIENHRL